jgi:hypothetical protein
MRLTSNQRSFLGIGLPMITLLIGGSYGLSVFIQGKNEARDKSKRFVAPKDSIYKKNAEELERKAKQPLTLEEEYDVLNNFFYFIFFFFSIIFH